MREYLMYLRKSRADIDAEARGEGETLARHKTMLSALAKRNKHHIPESNIYHEVVSGESISDRPQVQLLLERLRTGSIDGVYVMELERFARGDTIDQGTIARSFKYSRAKIITPMKTYDPDNEFDEEYFEFGLFMSRREYKTINRRIQSGRLQSVREGKFASSRAPYGYRRIKLQQEKGYTLEIYEEEANIVRNIFDWYINGRNGEMIGITAIANQLHDMGVHPGNNGELWNKCRIYRMLTNEVYIGMIRWGRDKTVRQLTDSGVVKTREEIKDYQLYEGLHKGIVGKDTFEKAQSILHNHGKIPVNKTSEMSNPLSRILYCAECGKAMLGNPGFGRIKPYVKCRTRGCPTVQTAREPLENAILATLKVWFENINMGGDAILPTQQTNDVSVNKTALVALKSEKETLLKQRDKLQDLVEQGVYSVEMFNERFNTLNDKLDSVSNSIAINEAEIKKSPAFKDPLKMMPLLCTVLDTYSTSETAQEKNNLLMTVISRIEYRKSVKGKKGVSGNQFELTIYPAFE